MATIETPQSSDGTATLSQNVLLYKTFGYMETSTNFQAIASAASDFFSWTKKYPLLHLGCITLQIYFCVATIILLFLLSRFPVLLGKMDDLFRGILKVVDKGIDRILHVCQPILTLLRGPLDYILTLVSGPISYAKDILNKLWPFGNGQPETHQCFSSASQSSDVLNQSQTIREYRVRRVRIDGRPVVRFQRTLYASSRRDRNIHRLQSSYLRDFLIELNRIFGWLLLFAWLSIYIPVATVTLLIQGLAPSLDDVLDYVAGKEKACVDNCERFETFCSDQYESFKTDWKLSRVGAVTKRGRMMVQTGWNKLRPRARSNAPSNVTPPETLVDTSDSSETITSSRDTSME